MLSNNKAWENISLYQSKNFSKVLLGSTACLLEGIRYSLFLEMKIMFRIINAFEESCLASLYALVFFFFVIISVAETLNNHSTLF